MKSKRLRIFVDLVLIILGIIFLVFGIKDTINTFKTPSLDDNIKFSKSYSNVPTDNNYKYIGSLDSVKDVNYVIFVGYPKDVWSQVLANTLYTILKGKYDIIYYLETTEEIVPQLFISKNKQKKIYKKGDLIDANYNEAPILYWEGNTLNNLIELFD